MLGVVKSFSVVLKAMCSRVDMAATTTQRRHSQSHHDNNCSQTHHASGFSECRVVL